MSAPSVVLVGPPGAGKSTVGRILAQRLGADYRDVDADIEAATGSAISDIFVREGEAYFRGLEKAAVKVALAEHEGVLALGGGAILDEDTRVSLKGDRVVFLDVGLAEAASRVGLNRDRPLLLGNVRSQLKALMDARRPLYEEVAVITVLTDGRAPEQIVEQIVGEL